MNDFLNRISEIAENENIKITALEKKIGASKGVLSRAINNNTDIQVKWLIKIVENYPKYDANWILTGQEPKYKMSLNSPHENNEQYLIELQKKHIEKLEKELQKFRK